MSSSQGSMNDNNEKHQNKNDLINKKLQVLRVQQSELNSGNLSGRVYKQPSQGAAFFLTERSVLSAEINKQVLQEVSNAIPDS